jgi:hypothetical protein
VKLPPVALTAPTLCPRCDAPALYEDRCTSCGLQLSKCGACQGVAGPFDRFCGFCGHDLTAGEVRSPVWRFWLLVAMLPMIAVLVVGATVFGGPAAVARLVFPPAPAASPSGLGVATKLFRSPTLHLVYAVPSDWSPSDYTLSTATPLQEVVVARINADLATFGSTKGDVLAAKPAGALLTLGPLTQAPPGVDPADPSSVLGADISSLTIKPPAGFKIDVFRPAQSIQVEGRAGKETVLKVTRSDGAVLYLERVYLAGPGALFKIDALVPQSDWEAGDGRKVEAVVQSVRLSG